MCKQFVDLIVQVFVHSHLYTCTLWHGYFPQCKTSQPTTTAIGKRNIAVSDLCERPGARKSGQL